MIGDQVAWYEIKAEAITSGHHACEPMSTKQITLTTGHDLR